MIVNNLAMMYLSGVLCFSWALLSFLDLQINVFHQISDFLVTLSLDIFFLPFSLCFLLHMSPLCIDWFIWWCPTGFWGSLLFFYLSFTCSSYGFIFNIIGSVTNSNMLLDLSSNFIISVIWLFNITISFYSFLIVFILGWDFLFLNLPYFPLSFYTLFPLVLNIFIIPALKAIIFLVHQHPGHPATVSIGCVDSSAWVTLSCFFENWIF